MTGPLTRAKDWLVAPPGDAPPGDAPPEAAPSDDRTERPARWLAPVPSVPAGADGDPAPARRRDAPPRLDDSWWEPAGPVPSPADGAAAGWDWTAVLGETRDVPAVAAGLALALRRQRRTPAAVVAVWPYGDDSAESLGLAAPAWPGARLLAGRLARRGLTARAHGRLVWLPLAADARLPVPTAAPAVLAVMAPRDAAVDAVLGRCEQAVVVADPESPLATLAVAELEDVGVAARAVAPPPPGAARLAALAGLRALDRERA